MSRKTRTKSKTRNNAKSRAKKATVSTVKSTDTEETVIPTAEPAIIKEEVAQPEPKEEIKIETPVEENQVIEQPDWTKKKCCFYWLRMLSICENRRSWRCNVCTSKESC